MLPDGTINPGEMTSFNHYALGAVADWMHKAIGGIRPLAPGYAKVLFAPRLGQGIDWAKTSLASPHGTIRAEWHFTADGKCQLTATVPPGVAADVELPGSPRHSIGAGTHTLTSTAVMPAGGNN
jgi:alpha-L-rhamnosidase